MDVTFTNVLEGARQYFQGLPAATGSAASPVQPTLSYGSAASTPTTYTTPSSASTIAENTTPSTANSGAPISRQNSNEQANMQQHYWTQHSHSNEHHHQQQQQHQKEQEKHPHQQLPSHPSSSQSQSHSNATASYTQSSQQNQTKIPQQPMHNYQYSSHSQQVQQNSVATAAYQYPPRSQPQSHESNALQYSSHYSSTTHRPLNVQTRPPSGAREPVQSPSPKTQNNYHQLQTARHHHTPSPSASSQSSTYMSNYQHQTKQQAYYPTQQPQTQPQHSSSHAYTQPPASSQAYMPNHQFTPHSYSQQYLTSSSKQEPTPVTPNGSGSEHHRTATHNLPPIAALYHSNKSSRDSVQRLTNHRHHRNTPSQPQSQLSNHVTSNSMSAATVSTTTSSAMNVATGQQQQQSSRIHYSVPPQGSTQQYHPSSANHQNREETHSNSSASYQYAPPISQTSYTCTTSAITSSLTSTSTSTSMYQSSYSQHLQKLNKHVYQQDLNQKPQQQQPQQQQQQQQTPQHQSTSSKDYSNYQTPLASRTTTTSTTTVINTAASNQNVAPTASVLTPKQKRESPLDLSVKTVRTSADSTASVDDSEVHSSDSQRINKFYGSNSNSTMPPPAQAPPTGAYNPYELSNHQRISTNIRATTPAVSIAGGAPKVDFLPNFNVQSMQQHPRNSHLERPVMQQQHHPQLDKNQAQHSSRNTTNMPPYNNNSKMYYQQSSYVHPSASYPHSYPNMMPNAAHPSSYNQAQVPSKRTTEVLPRIEFPTPGHTSSKSPAMYPTSAAVRDVHHQQQQQQQRKRPSSDASAAVPNKIAKHDSWRQTIDQQIEQRFSSYTKQQQQQIQGHSSSQYTSSSSSSSMPPQQHLHQQQHLPPQQQQQQHHMQHLKQPISNHVAPSSKQQMINGHMLPNYQRPRDQYVNYSSANHSAYAQMKPPFANSQYPPQGAQQTPNHSQTYVPTMGQYPYSSSHHQPNVPNHSQHDIYQQNVLSRSNSNPKLSATSPVRTANNSYTGADKRVLSILRNSLEIKGAKEAQRKIEQGQQNRPQAPEMHQMRSASGVQQPKTDVQAPLQPKHGIGRQNVSPFPAANLLERTTNTPPTMYKIHFPRAVDSVRFETETITSKDGNQMPGEKDMYTVAAAQDNTGMQQPPTGDASNLDGLAAFLAARIRTKAELKQVGTNQIQNITSNTSSAVEHNITYLNTIKNNQDKALAAQLPRRRLFSRSEEEANALMNNNNNINASSVVATATTTTTLSTLTPHGPIRDSAIRSSSETSVFDFRDSDSESEMHVLERQSLGAMRKDRKSNKTLPPQLKDNEVLKTDESKVDGVVIKQELIEEEFDPFFSIACDKFLEQLKTNGGKKRGRRKKVIEPEVLAKLETVTKEKPIENSKENPLDNMNLEAVVKLENMDLMQAKEAASAEVQIKTETESKEAAVVAVAEEGVAIVVKKKSTKADDDSDSDVPLARRKIINTPVKREIASDDEDSIITPRKEKLGAKIKIEYSSDSSVSDSETIQSVSEKLRSRKQKEVTPEKSENGKRVLRSADSSPSKKVNLVTKKKAIFGDGSDFHPGWEEEVYKYKRSLRMPARLINITRAPHWHRMSTSLPDLDPCSPAASSLTDDTEFSANFNRRSLPSRELNDSSKIKRDILDSDIDSNSSFTFSLQKGSYDSEASCSSLKSTTNTTKKSDDKKNKENNNSIIDVLAERYSKFKRKRVKGKDQKQGPKIIPKSTDPLELLPTPSLGIGSPEKDKKVGRNKLKAKEENKLDTNNSIYLGFFRKETVNNFRDTFKKNSGFMGMGEPFSTVVLKSRTRTETRVMKQRATIREVFGEERPASAPPIACREDELSQDSLISEKEKRSDPKPQLQASVKLKHKENNVVSSPIRAGLRSSSANNNRKTKHLILTKKIRGRKRPEHLIKVLSTKQVPEVPEEKTIKASDVASIKSETVSLKSETPSEIEIGDESNELNAIPTTKRRLKLRNMRRKFSSGFDYIRKKKKIIKKETIEADGTVKVKRRGILPRPSPESVQDIQREIKTWVMNKGIGETHLHRAARLGYTDITVYCLEKMDCIPSPKDNAGYTPLHEACSRGHLDIARVLLQYGANVSESAQGGIRPLHEAAENGYVEIIRLLLSYGADPTLATYSGLTPLSLATDEETKTLLKHYMADIQGLHAPPWSFKGPASCFDPSESGYDPLNSPPSPDPIPEDEDLEIEMSEQQLPNLYILHGEPSSDRWVLLQDLSAILKIKSRDTLLRQINGNLTTSAATTTTTTTSSSTSSSSTSVINTTATNTCKNIIKELKFSDFMEQAHCCQLLCANEKINARSTKIALVKYTDKVKQLLGVERVVVTTR